MKLAAVTNEVAPLTQEGSLKQIFKTAVEHGITTFEARTIEGKRFPLISGSAWETLKSARDEFGISYSAASPGTFIGFNVWSDLVEIHRDQLWTMTMEMASKIDAKALITFAPQRSQTEAPGEFDRVVELLSDIVRRAADRGYEVQLENLPGTWADTSEACAKLLRAVNHPAFGYVWDTGNLYEAEQTTFEKGFETLKPFIRNVHLKDGEIIDGKMVWKHYGTGKTDLAGQIKVLKDMDYSGTIALEAARIPHQAGDFEASFGYLKSIL